MSFSGRLIFLGALFYAVSDAFVPRGNNNRAFAPRTTEQNAPYIPLQPSSQVVHDLPLVALFAKKKKGNANAKLAALDALDALDDDVDAPLSKKELKALEKKKKKDDAAAAADTILEEDGPAPMEAKVKPMSKKEKMLAKALELEMMDASDSRADEDETPKLSKKELKALKKKEEKMAAKAKKESREENRETGTIFGRR